MTPGQRFRQILSRPDLLVLPGVYDCLGVRLAAEAGFEAAFTSGFGLSASLLGRPDYGFLTATQVLEAVSNMTRVSPLPLIADLDTGYGNPLNVYEVVQQAVRANVAGVILEDQVWPKRCGHFSGKEVIPAQEHVRKIKAAVEARKDSGLVIFGRTDARATHGLAEALKRGAAYLEAGADVIFVEAPLTREELEQIPRAFPKAPTMANMIEGGRTPLLAANELQRMGFRIAVFPLSALFAATAAIRETFSRLRNRGAAATETAQIDFASFEKVIGIEDYRKLEERFSAESPSAAGPQEGTAGDEQA